MNTSSLRVTDDSATNQNAENVWGESEDNVYW